MVFLKSKIGRGREKEEESIKQRTRHLKKAGKFGKSRDKKYPCSRKVDIVTMECRA